MRDDGRLVGMGERAYDSEDLLQSLLESYPKLLAGDQVDSANPDAPAERHQGRTNS